MRKGFTLIELMVVMMIIGILTATTLGVYSYVSKTSAVSKAKADLEAIRMALEEYRADKGYYPPISLSFIVEELEDANPTQQNPLLLTIAKVGTNLLQALSPYIASDVIKTKRIEYGASGDDSIQTLLDPWDMPYFYGRVKNNPYRYNLFSIGAHEKTVFTDGISGNNPTLKDTMFTDDDDGDRILNLSLFDENLMLGDYPSLQ